VKIDPSLLFKGTTTVNLSALVGKLVDLQPGETRTMLTLRPGFDDVEAELKESIATTGAAAGIPSEVYNDFLECGDTIDAIDTALSVVAKLAEVLVESRAYYENKRQHLVGLMVDTVRSTARRRNDSALLAFFEKTIKYHGQAGHKAARTRRRNQEEAAATEQTEQTQS